MSVKAKDMRRYKHRVFQCAVCGEKAPAGKIMGETKPGHIKYMYCIRCRYKTEHVQIE